MSVSKKLLSIAYAFKVNVLLQTGSLYILLPSKAPYTNSYAHIILTTFFYVLSFNFDVSNE